MRFLLPACILALVSAAIVAASQADPLTIRFRLTNNRIEQLFGHRTEEAAKAPVALNPFRVGSDTVAAPESATNTTGPVAMPVLTDEADQLNAGVRSLKVEGVTIRANQAYATINGKTYQEGDQVATALANRQRVFLKVLKIVPSATGQRGTVTFGLNDLQIEVSL